MAAHLVPLCERSMRTMELWMGVKRTALRIYWVSGGIGDVM
jgi:hypothetical protein